MADHTDLHAAASMPGQSVQNWASLGRLIQGARKERGMTQAGLAGQAGVSRAWLAKVESGHRAAEFELILRVLDALELDLFARPRRRSAADLDLAAALAERRRRPGSAEVRDEEDW